MAYGPEGGPASVRLEGPFELKDPRGAAITLDPQQEWEPLAALFPLRYDKMTLLRITKPSELTVEFESGYVITSSADARYEHWQADAPGGVKVIALPGGVEPAIWDGETPATRIRIEHGKSIEGEASKAPDSEA